MPDQFAVWAMLINVVLPIKAIFPENLWNVLDDEKLAVWLLSDNSPFVIPDELIFAAKELIENKGLNIKAKDFFVKDFQQASFFGADYWKEKTDLEIILEVNPDFIFGDLYRKVFEEEVTA